MGVAILTICAFIGGAACVFFIYESRKALMNSQERRINKQVEEHQQRSDHLNQAIAAHNDARRTHEQNFEKSMKSLNVERQALSEVKQALDKRVEQFNHQYVTYEELVAENRTIKTDLKNIVLTASKQDFENKVLADKQTTVDAKANALGRRYLKDTLRWMHDSLTPNNFAASKQRLLDAIAWCREIGVEITKSNEEEMLANLKQDYERVVRLSFEREEQARIRAQIREEQQHEREVQRAIEEAEREKRAVEAALAKLRAEADGRHTEEIQKLEAQLAEAIANSQRAISQAQLTKAGNVYVISNLGTLGQDVYKIGMTRRLDPHERVRELGGASVPFPYDVHMMIATNNAPGLENAFHRAFHKMRVNKANPRKEFFKVTLDQIVKIVEREHGVIEYKADPEALQYWQSINMKEEDQEFIEQVFDKVEAAKSPFADEED
ncbi:MAG: GIY-YIG nuclease family protein [Gemmatales bacterium]